MLFEVKKMRPVKMSSQSGRRTEITRPLGTSAGVADGQISRGCGRQSIPVAARSDVLIVPPLRRSGGVKTRRLRGGNSAARGAASSAASGRVPCRFEPSGNALPHRASTAGTATPSLVETGPVVALAKPRIDPKERSGDSTSDQSRRTPLEKDPRRSPV